MTTTDFTSTVQTTPTSTATAGSRPSLRRVARDSSVGAIAGAAVLFAYGAAAVAVHGPMQVGDPGQTTPITAASFAIGVLFSSFFGVLIAVALARWAKHAARTFQRSAIALTVVSLWAPYTARTDDSTKVLLGVGHVVAACVVIPLIVRALRTRLV